jgi:hypothetical protein
MWRHIPEDGILHSHRRGNLKSYVTQALSHPANFNPEGGGSVYPHRYPEIIRSYTWVNQI